MADNDSRNVQKDGLLSIILPTYNEHENIIPLIEDIVNLINFGQLEIIVVDDNSIDGTASLVRQFTHTEDRVKLIRRIGRFGLASAIKEGLLSANGAIAVVMDADGQHEPSSLISGVKKLREENLDLVVGSRFLLNSNIKGLSSRRRKGSSVANKIARFSLSSNYGCLTDYMSGFMIVNLSTCMSYIEEVDLHGFKFFYELLSVSKGTLKVGEIPLIFQARSHGDSKLDIAIFWDFLISFLHNISFRILPRKAISFAVVGSSGVFVQLLFTEILMSFFGFYFERALPCAVLLSATSNYLINNALTFRVYRLRGIKLLLGLIKFLLVASLPVLANVGLATTFYSYIFPNPFWAQMAGIVVVFIWNYAASSRFVWNTP